MAETPHSRLLLELVQRLSVLEASFAEYRLTVLEAFGGRDHTRDAASLALEARLATMNEFRAAMSDQASQFIRRTEHELLMAQFNTAQLDIQRILATTVKTTELEPINKAIGDLRQTGANQAGRYSVAAIVLSVVLVGINIIVQFLLHGH